MRQVAAGINILNIFRNQRTRIDNESNTLKY